MDSILYRVDPTSAIVVSKNTKMDGTVTLLFYSTHGEQVQIVCEPGQILDAAEDVERLMLRESRRVVVNMWTPFLWAVKAGLDVTQYSPEDILTAYLGRDKDEATRERGERKKHDG